MKVPEIITAIRRLSLGEKHRLIEFLIDGLTSLSVTGTVLEEISERKNKT